MRIPLKIRPMSDIHLEFGEFTVRPLPNDKETVLILAGDIGIVHKASQLEGRYGPFLARCSEQFMDVVLIMGNHEHYYGSFIRTQDKLQEEIDRRKLSNVHLLDKQSVVINGVNFIGATLWTNCEEGSPHATYMWNSMSDSKLIRTGHSDSPYLRKFLSTDTVMDHSKAKQYIIEAVARSKTEGLKTVVVVHHGVTHQSIPEMFRGDALNMFFVSELTLDFMDMNPDLLVHGHVHEKLDYMIDSSGQICQTRFICNPRGYVGHETTGFDDSLIIEV